MKKTLVSLLRSRRTDSHQELAAAVIRRAVLDASSRHAPEPVRLGARAFLADSPMLRHWCGVAGLDPEIIRARVLKQAPIGRPQRRPVSRPAMRRVA